MSLTGVSSWVGLMAELSTQLGPLIRQAVGCPSPSGGASNWALQSPVVSWGLRLCFLTLTVPLADSVFTLYSYRTTGRALQSDGAYGYALKLSGGLRTISTIR